MSSSVMFVAPNVYRRTGSPGASLLIANTMTEIPIRVGIAYRTRRMMYLRIFLR